MPNEIRTSLPGVSPSDFTITLASLADGSGRSSAAVTNTNERPAALISCNIRSGAMAPTANAVYEIYLLRSDSATTPIRDDNWASTDAAFTQLNAPLLGSIVLTATDSFDFTGTFDTSPLGPLGEEWGIAVVNQSGQAISTTEADHTISFRYYLPEVQ